MEQGEYRQWAGKIAQWTADYREKVKTYPVRAQVEPGEITGQLPAEVPNIGTDMETIFNDFEKIILPGMTHWQHPSFFAYFPANSCLPSILAEFVTAALGANCMLWQTSPAATELETLTLDWLRQAVGIPAGFEGVIQDTASTATLAAVLVMRERALDWKGNKLGLSGQKKLRIYSSEQVHTSIDRAIWFAGIGEENLVRIPTSGPLSSMDPEKLESAIVADLEAGYLPIGIIASVGGTNIGGTDNVGEVCKIAKEHGLYVHVDAAWAGAAMICPEFRDLWDGVENADSVVLNPHKWLGVQFDCSAHFIRNSEELTNSLAIRPEYLKTASKSSFINYSEWSPQLGRRFRALKLWFVLRYYGIEGLQKLVRNHIEWSKALAERIRSEPDFEIVTEPMLSLFTFRYCPAGEENLSDLNLQLLEKINNEGQIFLTRTIVGGQTVLRFQVGQFDVQEADIHNAFSVICECARKISS